MLQRLMVVCALEAVLAALLAVQVFASPAPNKPPNDPTNDSTNDSTTEMPKRGAADLDAPTRGDRTEPPPAASTPPPTREQVAAKWREGDPVGVLLTGSLRLADGRPASASLSLVRDTTRLGASTTADGAYAAVGLSPGEWQATVRGESVVTIEETLTITDEAVQQHDFVLDAAFRLRVTIATPDGEDATTAVRKSMPEWGDFGVVGQRDPLPERLAPTDYGRVFVGDARWNSEMNPRDGFAGTLFVTSLPAHVGLMQRHLLLQQQVVAEGAQEVRFVVDVEALRQLAGSATMRLVDADTGAPLEKARVMLNTSSRGGGGVPTDADGRVVLEGLSPGLLQCTIWAADHEHLYRVVRIDPGQRLDLGELRLGREQALAGTVLGPDGKPASATVRWTELKWRTTPTEFRHNLSTSAGAEGQFQLGSVGTGPIAITARSQGAGSSADLLAVAVVDNPPREPVVLRLASACRCTITRPADPARSFVVTLLDAEGRAVEAHALETRTTKFPITMPAGDYGFTVHDQDDRLVQSGTLTFGNDPTTLEIR